MKKKVIRRKKPDYLPIDIMIGDPRQFEIDFELVDDVRCECGAEKTCGKNTAHSSWCPKYKKA